MTFTPRWKSISARHLSWRTWDDESVVFNSLSGDTHFLDFVACEGLLCLGSEPLCHEKLCEQLATRLGVDVDAELRQYATRLLARLTRSGLVEREAEPS
jgi:PqqD family protein of HPr-rel-A system